MKFEQTTRTIGEALKQPDQDAKAYFPRDFGSLALEMRTHVDTACAAYHLGRRPQTLRAWASLENGPIRPIRINGRLAWPVAELRRVLQS